MTIDILGVIHDSHGQPNISSLFVVSPIDITVRNNGEFYF